MRNTLLLFMALAGLSGKAQVNFEPGYIINEQQVKTECMIRNQAWKSNPTAIECKLDENGAVQTISIANLREFNVGGSYKYKRFTVNLDRASSDTDKLSTVKNPEFKQETLLLKLLVEGQANLYQYEDHNLVRFFISLEPHEHVEQLVYKPYRAEYNYVSENNHFRQQLLTTLKSTELGQKDFEKLPYKKKELVALIVKYNGNGDSQTVNYEPKQNKGKINLNVITGVLASQAKMHYPGINKDFDFAQKFSPTAALELEYVLPFNQYKWSLFVAPTYTSYKDEFKFVNTMVSCDYKAIEVAAGIRHFLYLNSTYKLFLNAGFSFDLDMGSQIRFGQMTLDPVNTTHFISGVGFAGKNIGMEFRYNFQRGIGNDIWTANYKSFGLLVKYNIL